MLAKKAFVDAFNQVHEAFRSCPADIELAKAAARLDMASAERAYLTTAAMLNAGWKPLNESANAFILRTGYQQKVDA